MTAEPVDVDNLPPTQYLILDVLAARYRTGVRSWAFPAAFRPHLRKLESAGLINWQAGVGERTIQASLTDTGKAAVLTNPPPLPLPATRETVGDIAQTLRAAADGRREYAASISESHLADRLESEAITIAHAARVVDGDLGPLYNWLPSWRWTDEMHAALDARRHDRD